MSVDRSRLPTVGPDRLFHLPRPSKVRVGPGVETWSVEHREVPVLAAVLLLPVGAAHDPATLPGLAAMTADLLDEGAAHLDSLALHEALARLGAHLEIECTPDATVVGVLTLARHAEAALQLLTEVCFQPSLTAEDFERVRALRLNRLSQMRDVPSLTADRVFLSTLFGRHPYAHLPIGTEQGLDTMTVDDVRAFHRRVFRPELATLVMVGDVSHAGAEALAERVMSRVPQYAQEDGTPRPGIEPALATTHPEVIVVNRSRAQQSEVRVGQVGVARATPDYHSLVVANAVLGGQFTSRVNMNLREQKGYTYGARSYFEFRASPGPFIVQASVQTDASAAALVEIFHEMDGLRGERPVTERELDLARQGLTRGYARNFETVEQIARAMVQLALHRLPEDTFDRFIEGVRAVDETAVTAVAQRHFIPDSMLSVIVGDEDHVGPALDAAARPWRSVPAPALAR